MLIKYVSFDMDFLIQGLHKKILKSMVTFFLYSDWDISRMIDHVFKSLQLTPYAFPFKIGSNKIFNFRFLLWVFICATISATFGILYMSPHTQLFSLWSRFNPAFIWECKIVLWLHNKFIILSQLNSVNYIRISTLWFGIVASFNSLIHYCWQAEKK